MILLHEQILIDVYSGEICIQGDEMVKCPTLARLSVTLTAISVICSHQIPPPPFTRADSLHTEHGCSF